MSHFVGKAGLFYSIFRAYWLHWIRCAWCRYEVYHGNSPITHDKYSIPGPLIFVDAERIPYTTQAYSVKFVRDVKHSTKLLLAISTTLVDKFFIPQQTPSHYIIMINRYCCGDWKTREGLICIVDWYCISHWCRLYIIYKIMWSRFCCFIWRWEWSCHMWDIPVICRIQGITFVFHKYFTI